MEPNKEKTKQEAEVKAIPKVRIKIRSYDSKVLDNSCRQIVEIAGRTGVDLIGPIPLPTEIHRYTVNRSTFVHKDAREQFEMRIHKRLIEVKKLNPVFIETLRDLTLPAGVEIEIKTV
ncbi:30S ribosomal protein S10 [bacterium]|nr:30S ribosomal protein S10 [bacterium]